MHLAWKQFYKYVDTLEDNKRILITEALSDISSMSEDLSEKTSDESIGNGVTAVPL